MVRSLCIFATALALGIRPLPAAEATPATEESKPALDQKAYQERNDTLNRLINESIELSRTAVTNKKHGKPVTQEDLDRLEELHVAIKRLNDQQTAELLRAEIIRKAARLTESPAPQALAPDDPDGPADLYFQGWLLTREAEKLKAADKLSDSREKLETAVTIFERVAKQHPDWKPQMVQGRLAKTKEDLSALPPKDH